MNKFFLIFYVLGAPILLTAQNLISSTDRIVFYGEIDYLNNSLEIERIENPSDQNIIRRPTLDLENYQMVIRYVLRPIEIHYDVEIEVLVNGENLPIQSERFVGPYGKRLENESDNDITWTGILEDFHNLKGTFQLRLSVTEWSYPRLPLGMDCDNPPVFSANQRLTHLYVGVGGMAVLGASEIFRAKSNDIYDNEYVVASTREEGDPIYDKANRQNKLSIITRYSGAAIVAGDLIWYLMRNSRYRNRLALFNEHCNQQVSWEPFAKNNPNLGPSVGMSLKFSLN